MTSNLHPLVVVIIQIGAVATAITALFIMIERIWSPIKNWLERILTQPVLDRIDEHEQYVKYHLGPNGDNPAIHERLKDLESTVTSLKGEV